MKIGIISEFKIDTVNYGNNLQAYALNKYLRDRFSDHEVETIFFKDDKSKHLKVTSYFSYLKVKIGRIWWKIKGKNSYVPSLDYSLVEDRLKRFHLFQKENIVLSQKPYTWEELLKSDYDVFIVGSDVVWNQSKAFINQIKFLDFKSQGNAFKISYAASFGQNMIPPENRKSICRALQDFKAISVRESSAVELLNSIGVENVVQTLDPTLLLTCQEWEKVERAPTDIDSSNSFIFAYLLGADKQQIEIVKQIGKVNDLPIVYIPYAAGVKHYYDYDYGDIPLKDCSPEEWLWLIHHAQLILTDSFHGVVFSTIFQKNFLVLKRNYIRDINVRLTDYLELIDQADKMVTNERCLNIDLFHWDYKEIDFKLQKYREFSENFLVSCFEKQK